ncbi:helix-turn-helix domain-containing protein [Serratia fonticola]
MKVVGDKLKNYREKANLDQEQLASLCGWPTAFRVSKYEEGLKSISIEDAIALSSVLGVPPSCFLYESIENYEYIRYKSTSIPIVGVIDSGNIKLKDYVLTTEGAHGDEKHLNIVSYRLYGLKVHSKDMEPSFLENDVLIVDSKTPPITNDFVIVKSFLNGLSIKKFVMSDDNDSEPNDTLNTKKKLTKNGPEIAFILGSVVGSKALETR